jgi:hypothetical protein
VGYTGGNCSSAIPCGRHPGYCSLKPGQPPQYGPICTNASASKAQCDKVQISCAWDAPTPSGRPCPLKFSPSDLTGLWSGYGALSKAMFWAQPTPPGPAGSVCNDGSTDAFCYRIQCITGNYSVLPQDGVSRMISFGSGCPWSSTVCTSDRGGPGGPNKIVCNFHGGDTEAAVSADGTVIGPAPNYPGSGLGLHRYTGAMTGLWAAVNDTVSKTTDVYLVGHNWAADQLGVYWFPATSDTVGAWQYAEGSALPTAITTGSSSPATVELAFNSMSRIGTKRGVLNAASDAITGDGGLAGWTKRTGICSNNTLPCAQRLPANNLGSYRNVQYENPGCQGSAGHVQDHGLTSGCPDFGTAGAHFGYNYSSGNLTIRVFDGSDCLCGKFTPINPWNGGGDCTCPSSRCTTNLTHYLRYHVRFGMNESTAPCVAVPTEAVRECGNGVTEKDCKSQRWFPTPVADQAACAHELEALCAVERAQGTAKCQSCADVAGNWNKLRVVGCTDSIVSGLCGAVPAGL